MEKAKRHVMYAMCFMNVAAQAVIIHVKIIPHFSLQASVCYSPCSCTLLAISIKRSDRFIISSSAAANGAARPSRVCV